MKNTILLFCLALFLSCQHPKQLSNGKLEHFVAGKWSLFEIDGPQSSTNFNVCPIITFAKIRSGIIKRSSPVLIHFTWSINNDRLMIKHTINKDSDEVIDDGVYKLIHSAHKTFQEMDLVDTIQHIKYCLGR